MSVATIHELSRTAARPGAEGTARPVRPVRPVPDNVGEAPASVTVTVRIDLPGGRLPESAAHLVASLRALATTGTALADPAPLPSVVAAPAIGEPGLAVFLASRIVLRDGVPVRLTRREFDLLAFFGTHPRQVFERRQLLRQVWGYEMVGGERTVDVHVRRLRVKLGEPGPLIATVRGIGYRLDEAARLTVVTGAG
jgi:hypothetical protein